MIHHQTERSHPDLLTRVGAAAAVLLAIWAYAGAIGLISGGIDFGEPIDSRLPWRSLPLAGVALLLVVAVPMTAAAISAWLDKPSTAQVLVLAGAAQIGWIAVQLVVIRSFSWLQPVCVVLGLLLVVVGLRRRTGGRERS